MKRNLLTVLAAATSFFAFAQTTQTFNYTGSMQTFTVPPCVTSITIETYGAQGGNASIGGTGGLGGYAIGTLAVTPGDVLNIYVGGQNGYNGGGAGGQDGNTAFSGPPGNLAPSGGGASDVRLNGITVNDRIIVAGGGGGAGSNGVWPGCQVAGPAGNGGAGGGLTGGNGLAGVGTPCNCGGGGGDGGLGGTQTAGGIHGNYAGSTACLRSSWTAGQDGTLAQGGAGSLTYYNGTGGGGGGGGGYYGGGSGGNGSDTTPGGGGGGGSSWTGTLTSASTTPGTRSGDGMVVLTYSNSASLPSSPTSISGSNSVCVGATVTFTISSVVGATGYTWTVPSGSTINSGQNTTSISVTVGSTSGTVAVTANNACGSSAPTNLSLTVNPLPTVAISPSATTICSGSSAVLTASGASTYVWSSGGNTAVETVTPTAMTSYTVTGTDLNGCVNTASVMIMVNPLPTVTSTSSNSTVCAGTNDTLTASGATSYAWSSGGNTATEIVSPSTTTTYTVTGTDANGCQNTSTITVNVNALPNVSAVAINNTICIGNNVTLNATGASTYLWQPINQTGSTAMDVPAATTTYTVTGTDANGCVNTASVLVTVNALPDVVASALPNTICAGDTANISATGANTYVWQPGNLTNASEMVSPSATTNYTVTGTDANGCSNTDMVTVTVNPLPVLSLAASNNTPCVTDAAVTLTGTPSGGTWSGPGVTGSTFNPSTAGVGAHSLNYTYTNPNTGCSNTNSISVTVNGCVGIVETTLENGVNVFPNPNAGVFTLTINANVGDMHIEITDATGRVVYSSLENNVSAGFTKQITLEGLASGLYTMKLSTSNEQKVQQISIVR